MPKEFLNGTQWIKCQKLTQNKEYLVNNFRLPDSSERLINQLYNRYCNHITEEEEPRSCKAWKEGK